jgi:hypothetical protein
MSLPGQSRPAHSIVAGWARLPALGDLPELMGLIFLLCVVPLFFLDLLLFHPLVSLSPHFFKVIGLCIARFPSQPRWFFHDLSSPLVANEDKLGPKRKFRRDHHFAEGCRTRLISPYTHVLATMVEGRVSCALRERDHSRRRSQPTPSSRVGSGAEVRRDLLFQLVRQGLGGGEALSPRPPHTLRNFLCISALDRSSELVPVQAIVPFSRM